MNDFDFENEYLLNALSSFPKPETIIEKASNVDLKLEYKLNDIIEIIRYDAKTGEYEIAGFRYKKDGDKFYFINHINYIGDKLIDREIAEEIPYFINSKNEFEDVVNFIGTELDKLGY